MLPRTSDLNRAVVLLAFAVAACRYGYELLPVDDDSGMGAAAGNVSTAGAGPGDGGAGAVDMLPDGGNDSAGGAETNAGNGSSGGGASSGGSTAGSSGSGGSSVGVPPDLSLCNQASYGGHDYLLCQEPRSWAAANGGCLAIGMRLIRIDDDAENQWLNANANVPSGANGEVWLGATDEEVEGEWRWTDGDLFWLGDRAGSAQNALFSLWYFREPNNVDIENCAVLDTRAGAAEWYDFDCELTKAYACESP